MYLNPIWLTCKVLTITCHSGTTTVTPDPLTFKSWLKPCVNTWPSFNLQCIPESQYSRTLCTYCLKPLKIKEISGLRKLLHIQSTYSQNCDRANLWLLLYMKKKSWPLSTSWPLILLIWYWLHLCTDAPLWQYPLISFSRLTTFLVPLVTFEVLFPTKEVIQIAKEGYIVILHNSALSSHSRK